MKVREGSGCARGRITSESWVKGAQERVEAVRRRQARNNLKVERVLYGMHCSMDIGLHDRFTIIFSVCLEITLLGHIHISLV